MSSTAAEIYDPLADAGFLRVTAVEVLGGLRLRTTFSDGAAREVDFAELAATSRWFRPLAESTTFETVEIIHDGRALQWATGVDFCADALRIRGDEQRLSAAEETL